MTGWVGATRPSLNGGGRGCSRGNTGRWVYSRSLQSDILARCGCHHGDCSAFRSLELAKCHWPLQAALSGSLIKAPGFAGGYLLTAEHHRTSIVQKRGQDHGKGNSRAYCVADHMIDARSQTEPDLRQRQI